MPILASQLVAYGSLNIPEADGTISGGGIDTATRVTFIEPAASSGGTPDTTFTLEVLSDTAGDTARTITFTGRLSTGALSTTSPVTVNGTTPTAIPGTYLRVMKAIASATHASATITVRIAGGGTTVGTIGPTPELRFRRLFYDSFSTTSTTNRYEKFFWRNNHATLTLQAATVQGVAVSDTTGKLTFALDTTLNATATIATRLDTVPAGIGAFTEEGSPLSVATGEIPALSAQGIWLRLNLGANDAGAEGTYTSRLTGTTL